MMLSNFRSFLNVFREVHQIQVLSGYALVEVKHVFGLIFEVGSGVKACRDEETIVLARERDISLRDSHELLFDFSDHFQSHFNLLLWVIGLNGSADDGDVGIFFRNAVH